MTYKITAGDLEKLLYAEENTVESVLQNVALILATRKGSIPQYREFGVDYSALDLPVPEAKMMLIAPIREAIEEWEPRVQVKGITYVTQPNSPQVLIPVVEVEANV